jgi:hypothetical protein
MAGRVQLRIGRERAVMLCLLALAGLACLLGLLKAPSSGPHDGAEQALDLIRVLSTVSLVVVLLFGPGIAARALSRRLGNAGLAFLPLPGLGLLVATGGLAWALAGEVHPNVTCFALLAPALGLLLGCLLVAGPAELLDAAERRCLLIAGAALGLAVARALWSLGPEGELYAGTISRTLEVGDRSDSRISFIVPQLVAHDAGPYSRLATSFFFPYDFSSRGPLPGLASTPIVFLTGGRPPATLAEQPWNPFDPQGFMAYRLAMMAFACTALVSLWDLVRRLMGGAAARFALLLAATTPFLLHEAWFTWPKLLAASFVLLAGICAIQGRPLRAGLLAGVAYLMHPVALISLPALALIILWPLRGASWRRPRIGRLLAFAAGLGAFLLAWRLINGDHFTQGVFTDYLAQAGTDLDPGARSWLSFRLDSLANTLVPLFLPLSSGDNAAINIVGGTSPTSVHFFFQYWNTLPFGLAIVFFPLLLLSLWRAAQRWPWPVAATVVVPFAAFATYWGASSTGMMREGLQAWALTLIAVVACQQAAAGFPWLRSRPVRALLALRAAEVLAMAVWPMLVSRQILLGDSFALTDAIALLAMAAFSAALGALIWSSTPTNLGGSGQPAPTPRSSPAPSPMADTLAGHAGAGHIRAIRARRRAG